MKYLYILCLFFISFSLSYATTITVGNTDDSGAGSLRQAIFDSPSGDTILFDANIDGDTIFLTSGRIVLTQNIVILGNDTTNTIIDGNANSQIFEINPGIEVEIDGVRLQNGMVSVMFFNNGGAILNRGSLIMNNSSLIGNVATGVGGAIVNDNAVRASFKNCLFHGNNANTGGAVSSVFTPYLSFTNTIFSKNIATSRGGGIHSTEVDTTKFTDCILVDNMAIGSQGGGIYTSQNSYMTLNNCTIENNSGTLGGGLYLFNAATAIINNSSFKNNKATDQHGGGLYLADLTSVAIISFCIFSSNTAISPLATGGAIATKGSLTCTNVELSGNTATSGGAIRSYSGTVNIINSLIAGNSAIASNGGGGGVWFSGGSGKLVNTTITGNQVVWGGGILISSGVPVTLENSILAKNNAPNGPDIYTTGIIIDDGFNLIGDTTDVANQFPITTLKGGAIILDPMFVMDVPANDSLGGNLRLHCNSPAVNAGNPDTIGLNLGPVDLDSMSRLVGLIDIGPYEFGADITQPIAVCKDSTVYLNAIAMITIDSSYLDNGSTDNCGITSLSLDTFAFDCDDLGTFPVTMTAKDAMENINSCISQVTVILPNNIFVDNTKLSTLGESGTYAATVLVESDATIKTLNAVTFVAGNEILLHPNFGVEINSVFEAKIGGCGED